MTTRMHRGERHATAARGRERTNGIGIMAGWPGAVRAGRRDAFKKVPPERRDQSIDYGAGTPLDDDVLAKALCAVRCGREISPVRY
ncbi:hypothetical protein [Burkholderia pseudomultivorans]|uniref:hypothetical protein n=1 Tax=Burkholderia pseudomultivorans TaxID=1207504 RepID=UPI0018C745B8|nr:hypothetical protein [Burkholderia pseudomultivorans]